ncbi:hypothetical protein GDO78_011363 [Eleutherodactylus coqui]|uniref:Uncharacterized protein n=1 Tax=Eleutherodactylus coqui TaxID=57060 RepID=A0A8J6K7G8_ELECQ|nr:hypothetical protein GDO78_011363 [Eleutherodactylus coqui]
MSLVLLSLNIIYQVQLASSTLQGYQLLPLWWVWTSELCGQRPSGDRWGGFIFTYIDIDDLSSEPINNR